MKIRCDCFVLKNSSGEILVGREAPPEFSPIYSFYTPEYINKIGIPLISEIIYLSKATYDDIKNNSISVDDNQILISKLILSPVSLNLDIK